MNFGMIDVGEKRKTKRTAVARALVKIESSIIDKIKNNTIPKGNVLEAAKIAGVLAAKKTSAIIPLCHNIELEYAGITFLFEEDGIAVESLIKACGKTGVEMEALVACSAAALTIYDMCKMFSHSIEIQRIYLVEKKGGRSGVYRKIGTATNF